MVFSVIKNDEKIAAIRIPWISVVIFPIQEQKRKKFYINEVNFITENSAEKMRNSIMDVMEDIYDIHEQIKGIRERNWNMVLRLQRLTNYVQEDVEMGKQRCRNNISGSGKCFECHGTNHNFRQCILEAKERRAAANTDQ